MRSFRLVASVASLAILAACASAPPKEAADPKERIAADVAWLADDARMGREPGTSGYDEAADYVEKRMKSVGLKPAAIGWRQTAPLRSSTRVVNAAKFELESGGATSALMPIDDYIIGRSYDDPTFSVTAPLVYAGYGIVAPDEGVDDYAGLDVTGKIVVAFSGGPPSMNTEKRAYYSTSDVKLSAAAARGAVGVVSIMTKHDADKDNWKHVAARISSPAMETIGPDGKAEVVGESIEASAALNVSGATKVFGGERVDYATLMAAEAEGKGAPKGFALKKSATLAGASMLSDVTSDNVIGVIEGTDPVLRDEVVLLTAHLDHIGLTPAKKPGDDEINNGALDNAGGVAVMLEAARAFKMSGARPKRTVAFAAVTGEEKGLLGSSYLARHSAFGGKRIVANINLDMPIAIYPFTDVVAFGAERSSLGPVVRRAAEEMGLALAPDPLPEENLFVRSDHYSFVKEGAPSVFLVPGFANGGAEAFASFLKDHYHRPSDEISLPIDYDALARFADLNYRVARDLAADAQTPVWVEGDFFGELFSK